MRFRTTWILLLVVLLLGALIHRVERRARSTREHTEAARRALDFEPESIALLEIRSSNLVIRCVRKDERWMVVDPLQARADAGSVDRILHGLRHLERGEVITAADLKARGLGAEDYGLTRPRYVIGLGDGRRSQTLRVGRDAPLGDSLYIREDGREDIVAVSRRLLDLMPAAVSDLRDRALLPGTPERVQQLEIRRRDGFIQIARADRGRWMILQPVAARASTGAVQNFLEQLFLLRASEFMTNDIVDAAAYGFDDPDLQIGVALVGGEGEATVLFGDSADRGGARRYALTQPGASACLLEAAQVAPLDVKMDNLRDRKLTTLEARDVNRIVIEAEEKKIELQQEADAWRLVEPRRWKADDERVLEFLAVWTAPVIRNFLPVPANLAEAGLAPPAAIIRLGRRAADRPDAAAAAENEEAALWIGTGSGAAKHRLALVKPEGFVAEIPDSLLLAVSTDPLFYRDRGVLAVKADDVMKISTVTGGATVTVVRGASGKFEPAPEMPSGKVKEEAIAGLLRAVRDLRAKRFAASDTSPLSLDSEGGQDLLMLGLKGPGALGKTLVVGGEAGPSTRYAMIQGQEGIFELEKEACRILFPPLVESVMPSGEAADGTYPVDADAGEAPL